MLPSALQDPAAFVHRVGRTARMGRSGSALALLLPNESTYVEFLKLRKVPLVEGQLLPDAPDPADLSVFLRREAETDREMMEKGTRAFVSLVRGYKEHHCKFVFRIQVGHFKWLRVQSPSSKVPVLYASADHDSEDFMHCSKAGSDLIRTILCCSAALLLIVQWCITVLLLLLLLQELPLGPLAQSLGLLKLPRMPEVKKGSTANALSDFKASQVDPDSVKFKDKAREKQRQQVSRQKTVMTCSTPLLSICVSVPPMDLTIRAALATNVVVCCALLAMVRDHAVHDPAYDSHCRLMQQPCAALGAPDDMVCRLLSWDSTASVE